MFDWLTQMQASPLAYLAVLGACALDAVLPIVPSEAVVRVSTWSWGCWSVVETRA